MRYIYRLQFSYYKKEKLEYESFFCNNYFTREEAIEAGIKIIKNTIESYTEGIEDFLENYEYEFYIYITDLKHVKIDNKIRYDYINSNIPNDKSKIYEFLTSIADEVMESYDYKGNFKLGSVLLDDFVHYTVYLSYKSKFEPAPFKIGDIVKKNDDDTLYVVKFLPLYDENDILSYSDIVYIAPIDDNIIYIEDCDPYSYMDLIKI